MVYSFYSLIGILPGSTALVESVATMVIFIFFVKRGFLYAFELREKSLQGRLSFSQKINIFISSVRPPKNYLNIAIGAFVLMNILSVVFSQYPWISMKGFVTKWFEGVVLLWAFVECMKTKKQMRIFLVIFFAGVFITIVNGLTQYFHGTGFIRGYSLVEGRVSSVFKHPNDFGAYLVVAVLILVSFLMLWVFKSPRGYGDSSRDPRRRRVVLWFVKICVVVLFVGAGLCLGLTFSRGAWVGFLCGIVFLGIQRPKISVQLFLISVVFLIMFSSELAETRNVAFLSDNTKNIERVVNQYEQEDASISSSWMDRKILMLKESLRFNGGGGMGRDGFWKEALGIIRAFPVVGVGVNTYSKVVQDYKESWGGYPHNCYLQMAAEIGILGLVSFLWLVSRLIRTALKRSKEIESSFLSILSFGSMASFVGFLIHSFFDTNFYSVRLGVLMWILMGMIIVPSYIARREEKVV